MPTLFFGFRVVENKAIPQAVWVFTGFGRAKYCSQGASRKMNNEY